MTRVSNSSVLIALSAVGLPGLLREGYPEGIVIPTAVWREVVEEGGDRLGTREVATAAWITRQAPSDQWLVQLLRKELDAGEAEAIALAHELSAMVVLLDEKVKKVAAPPLQRPLPPPMRIVK